MQGLVVLSLFAEFLRYAQLESTLEVFTHEAELGKLSILDRDDLIKLLDLNSKPDSALLSTLLSTHRNMHSALQTDADAPVKLNSLDGIQPTSYDPTHQQHNGYECDANAPCIASNSTEDYHFLCDNPRSGVNNLQVDHSTALNDPAPSQKHSRPHNSSLSPAIESPKTDYRLNGSPVCPASSPRDEEYQDDFSSHASLNSQTTSSAASHHDEPDRRSGSQSVVSIHLIESARSLTPVNSSSSRIRELSRPASRNGTPSIVRIYSQVSRRSASTEESSDVDADGDDDQISELLRGYSVAGDSVDQTIASDESLELDHVELVKRPRDIS
ncbi:unnamed protein product [Dicrocoelium dendriticum]|nr:unnamed protein product [Dicrocoelium dendriticum]